LALPDQWFLHAQIVAKGVTAHGPTKSQTLPGTYFKDIIVVVNIIPKKSDAAVDREPGVGAITHRKPKI
jgi:hypothetical protein